MFPSKEAFLSTLFDEMHRRGDFPAISESVWKIVAVMDRDYEDFNLTQAILDDMALTQKVLRAASSVLYSRFGRNVTTVTQAVVLLGYNRIGHIALDMKLSTELIAASKGKDRRSLDALYRCTIAGTLTRFLARKVYAPSAEEAGVCGLLQGIGRVLVMFYLPHVWDEVEILMKAKKLTESQALRKLTGLTEGELRQAVAQHWGMPERLINALADAEEYAPRRRLAALSHQEWMSFLVTAGEKLCTRLEAMAYQATPAELELMSAEFIGPLGLDKDEFIYAVQCALEEEKSNPLLSVEPAKGSTGARAPSALRQLEVFRATLRQEAKKHSTRSLMGMTLESLRGIFNASRAVHMSLDPQSRKLVARSAVGVDATRLLGQFYVEADYAPDVFHLAIARNMPVLITDAAKLRETGKLPSGFITHMPESPAFMVIPFNVRGGPDTLLYLDWGTTTVPPAISERERAVLSAIRDLLVETLEERRAVLAPE